MAKSPIDEGWHNYKDKDDFMKVLVLWISEKNVLYLWTEIEDVRVDGFHVKYYIMLMIFEFIKNS